MKLFNMKDMQIEMAISGILAGLLILMSPGCVKVEATSDSDGFSVSVSAGESVASADVTACPTGMTLFPTATGTGAFCMDDTVSGTGSGGVSHSQAALACGAQGKEICNVTQMQVACDGGHVSSAYIYWTSTMTGGTAPQSVGMDGNGCDASANNIPTNINWKSPYYCCTR